MSSNKILIGGSPVAGKSYIAQMLAERLHVPWISTDQIRSIMRAVLKRQDYPALFVPKGYDAKKYLTEFSSSQIVDMHMSEGEIVWTGVEAFIRGNFTWRDGFIVEGINILPELVRKSFGDRNDIKTIFLIDEDANRVRKTIFERGLWGAPGSYADELKEREVAWVMEFNKTIEAEALKYDYPIYKVDKSSDDIDNIVQKLGMQNLLT